MTGIQAVGSLEGSELKKTFYKFLSYNIPTSISSPVYISHHLMFQIDRGYLTLEDFEKAFELVAPKLPKRVVIEVFR